MPFQSHYTYHPSQQLSTGDPQLSSITPPPPPIMSDTEEESSSSDSSWPVNETWLRGILQANHPNDKDTINILVSERMQNTPQKHTETARPNQKPFEK